MKILVIGGTQFMGRETVERLLARGHDVSILHRRDHGTAGVEPTLVPVPRSTIHAAGGEIMGGNLYFGGALDLPPVTLDVDRAARVLGLAPTPFTDAPRAGFEWYREQPRRPVDYTFEDRVLARA